MLDLRGAAPAFTAVLPLGSKDHSQPGTGFDASDRGGPNITTWSNVRGLNMPDAVATFERGGHTYLVTANEGDPRGDGDVARVGESRLDPNAFPSGAPVGLGRLEISRPDSAPTATAISTRSSPSAVAASRSGGWSGTARRASPPA